MRGLGSAGDENMVRQGVTVGDLADWRRVYSSILREVTAAGCCARTESERLGGRFLFVPATDRTPPTIHVPRETGGLFFSDDEDAFLLDARLPDEAVYFAHEAGHWIGHPDRGPFHDRLDDIERRLRDSPDEVRPAECDDFYAEEVAAWTLAWDFFARAGAPDWLYGVVFQGGRKALKSHASACTQVQGWSPSQELQFPSLRDTGSVGE